MMDQPSPPKAPPITPGEIPTSGPTKTSVMAIASLVLGVLGFCTGGLGGLIGVILGILALVSINKSAGRLGGQGLAIGGIVVSGVGLIAGLIVGFLAIGPLLLMPSLSAGRQAAQNIVSMNSLRQVGLAAESYAMDYNDYLPRSDDWVDLLDGYVQDADAVVSLSRSPEQGRAYAMNRLLDGLRYADVSDPERTVLFYEAQFGSPLAGGPELLPAQPRHHHGYVIVFVDGHIENVIPEAIDSLVWQP
ncbi:MAG: DUF4190 domain-containing protein [Planctomycetes bacterium]|nr:DUF4190 domain-containing protein [Planctomycetota bacterium]